MSQGVEGPGTSWESMIIGIREYVQTEESLKDGDICHFAPSPPNNPEIQCETKSPDWKVPYL